MFQNIAKRLGHIPSSALAIAILILWAALVFSKNINADGVASGTLLSAALGLLSYKPNEPKQNNV
jgi:hypothetical protein